MRALAIVLLLAATAHAEVEGDRKLAEERYAIGAKAYKAQNFAAAAEHFDAAYQALPVPELAFSAAQAYRRQYAVDNSLANARRAAELYRVYLDQVKRGKRVRDAADNLADLERDLARAPKEPVAAPPPVEPKTITTIVVSPSLESEAMGSMMSEISDAPADAQVEITSTVDGQPVPEFEAIEVEPGPHVVRVEADGYEPAELRVETIKNGQRTADIVLKPRPAQVAIATDDDARIHVDGRLASARPISVPAGKHLFVVSRRGRTSVARELDLERGQEVSLSIPLQSTGQRRIARWVAIGAVAIGGVSLVSLGAAVYYDTKAGNLRDRLGTTGNGTQADLDDYRDLSERRDQTRTAGIVLGGAAVIAAAAAVGLYLFDTPDEPTPVVAPMASGGASVMLHGRF
jgi:hypothetical protein